MNTRNALIGGILLIMVLGIVYALVSRAPESGTHTMHGGAMMSQNIDQHFIVQMIPHHDGAIRMAQVALERSERTEVRDLATAIITTQTRENADMRAWYQSWFNADVPTDSGMGHLGSMSGDMEELALASASEFDREFLTQMIPHHEMAIMMADMLKAGTERAEMKKLAEQIIASQSAEIASMRGWLSIWYGTE